MIAKLALEDGTVLTGRGVGASGTRTGEVVFNTAMTGYQEVLTDPSYCGQIVTMTFPLQGNYGVNPDDFESSRPHLAGVILRELPRRPSNHRATLSLPDFLEQQGVIGLANVDTRAVTCRVRTAGALRGVLSTEVRDDVGLVRLARAAAPMIGANLVAAVTPPEAAAWDKPPWRFPAETDSVATAQRHIVAIDCGIKHNILRHLVSAGCRVTVVPAGTQGAEILGLAPDGLLIGNGPGDPAAVAETIDTLRSLRGQIPMLGICLGMQLLAIAMGAETYKLRFGHHGTNVPVLDRRTGRVDITSQNHGFAVDATSLKRVGGTVTHVNLNDGSLEGFTHQDRGAVGVQYHPEASPGPHDGGYVLHRFVQAVSNGKRLDVEMVV